MSDKFLGEVVWFDARRGYGFISWEKDNVKQKDIFLHFSDLNVEGFKTVNKGQKIEFKLGKNKNDVLKAVEVTLVTVS